MPMNLVKQIEKIVANERLTRADKARALFDLGCERTDVVELTGMTYSQAHGIWKAGNYEQAPSDERGKARVHAVRNDGSQDRQLDRVGRVLQRSPTQVRVATQDGHPVIRIDRDEGPVCLDCGRKLHYSLKWLSFVHAASKKDPTNLEDNYS